MLSLHIYKFVDMIVRIKKKNFEGSKHFQKLSKIYIEFFVDVQMLQFQLSKMIFCISIIIHQIQWDFERRILLVSKSLVKSIILFQLLTLHKTKFSLRELAIIK